MPYMGLTWTNTLLSTFIYASVMRSACFPLMYHDDDNWRERLNEDIIVRQKDFQEITETVDKKLKDLLDNFVLNAYRSLPNVPSYIMARY